MDGSAEKKRGQMLAVICSQFPEMHETFVIRELRALHDAGIRMRIYSMKYCRDRIVHPEAKPLLSITEYVAWNNPFVWLECLWFSVFHPRVSFRSLFWILRNHRTSWLDFDKALIVRVQAHAMAGRFKRAGITHVHSHWATMPTTAALLVSRYLRIPFSFTAHAWDIFVKNPSLAEKVRAAKKVITCTEYNRRHLAEMCPDSAGKIALSYHGVDVRKWGAGDSAAGMEGEKRKRFSPLFLSVGRLVETKGYGDLIVAYSILYKRCAALEGSHFFQAVIVGHGPLRRRLTEQIRWAGLEGVVEIKPGMDQAKLKALYSEARAFVLPCVVAANGDRDGIPNVILEAMAAGLPVVSTTVSGIPEAVENGRNGLLVEPGRPESLADALGVVLSDEARAREMGAAGRSVAAEKFAAEGHMTALARLMREIIS